MLFRYVTWEFFCLGFSANAICSYQDFDGTIFMQDTGHVLFDNFGCGSKRRQVLDEQIKNGERSFRDVSEEMWGSLNIPFDDGFEVMQDSLDIDVDFRAFHACKHQFFSFYDSPSVMFWNVPECISWNP